MVQSRKRIRTITLLFENKKEFKTSGYSSNTLYSTEEITRRTIL